MLTIFTPTYNREKLIKKLYESLKKQTNYNFEWLVVDDGSTDSTQNFFNELNETSFNITYIYQKNQGKHVAYNKGVQQAQGNYFICVDSDDLLTEKAVDIILNNIEKYNNVDKIGFIYPQINEKLKSEISWRKIDKQLLDIIDTNQIYKIIDTAIVIKTKILKKYKFPIFKLDNKKNEYFCPEAILYNQLIKEGKFLALNQPFYISKYLPNGLSKNIIKIRLKNYKGAVAELYQRYITLGKYSLKNRILGRIKCIIILNAICIKTKYNLFKHTPSISSSIILYIPSLLLKKLIFDQVN